MTEGLGLVPLDLAGHVGEALLVGGTVALARGHRLGWLSRALGNVVWIAIGWRLEMSSIWTWGLVFVAIEVYGLLRRQH